MIHRIVLVIFWLTIGIFSKSAKADDGIDSFFDVVKNRRSIRQFKSTPVPEKDLMKILDAARMAPTAGNQQPWKFLIVRNPKKIQAPAQEATIFFSNNKK